MSKDPAGFLYVALYEDGLRKIGYTAYVELRMSQLARHGLCRVDLEHAQFHDRARLAEKVAHFFMRPHRAFPGTTCRSEMYRADLPGLILAIEDACFLVDTGLVPDLKQRASSLPPVRQD